MAIISELPAPSIIMALRGTVDYSIWRGRLYCRSWPRRPTLPRSIPVQQTAQAFRSYALRVPGTTAEVKDQALEITRGTAWTWKDLVTRAAYGNLITWE